MPKSRIIPPEEKQAILLYKKQKRKVSRRIVFAILLFLFCFMLFFAVHILRLDAWQKFDPDKILNVDQSLIIYDQNGIESCVLNGGENRIWVELNCIPKNVQKAFISAEDARFYEHKGIDMKRIFGAALADIKSGSYVQGASTITQQLIKLSHLSSEKKMSRKIEEAILACTMERQFSKDEILEMYLNYVYFGGGFYGIESASRGYFGIPATQLTISQGAMLAGVLKAPSDYAPHLDYQASVKRMKNVLRLMNNYGYISDFEYEKELQSTPLIVLSKDKSFQRGFYADTVINEACMHLNISIDELYAGGYRIYTGLDSPLQEQCENILSDDKYFEGLSENVEGAICAVSPKTGLISAVVGGRDSSVAMAFNRAIDIQRQPGSVIKPIIAYAPAMEYFGYTAASVIGNHQVDFNGYKPRNSNGKYTNPVTLKTAITKSLNVPAVLVLDDIGVETGKRFAESVGITFDKKDTGLALALGGFTYGVSPLQVANAYSVFASEGYYTKAYAISKIESRIGKTVFENPLTKTRVLSEANAYIITTMLKNVVEEGTGRNLGEINLPLAGKTGTSSEITGDKTENGNRDAWMVAYNTEYSIAVWLGCDSNKDGEGLPKNATGGSYPAEILKAVFSKLYENRSAADFQKPDDVIKLRIDNVSIEKDAVPALATSLTPISESFYEFFAVGTEPKNQSEYWKQPNPPTDLSVKELQGFPNITFSVNECDNPFSTVYRLFREDSMGNGILLFEFSECEKVSFIDINVPVGRTVFYYVVPVIVSGDNAIIGAESKRVAFKK